MPEAEDENRIRCPYCRTLILRREAERDHIPPRSAFHDPPPNNLITVQCCPACHDSYSNGDELLKLLVVSGKLRKAPIQDKQPSVERSVARNPWWKQHLDEAIASRQPKIVVSDDQIIPGSIVEFKGEARQAIERSIWRIVVGLLFRENQDFDAAGSKHDILFARDENPMEFYAELARMGPSPNEVEIGEGAFLARWFFAEDSSDHCVMYLSFYGGVNCVDFVSPQSLDS